MLGGGALIGQTDSPNLALSVLATAIVALGFEPVQTRLETAATRLVHGGTPSPYDVLSRFSETVTGGYTTEELPARMAMLLGQGTGAEWAQVWLTVQDRLTLAATWPPDAAADQDPPEPLDEAGDATGPGRRALAVRHGGQVLGVFRLQEPAGEPLTSVEERLFTGLAAQAGLVLRLVGLRAELAARHGDLVVRAAELRASRERLIETQDAERRRLERDIHDGAQQHLVALAVNLRLAETVATRSPERAAKVLADAGRCGPRGHRDAVPAVARHLPAAARRGGAGPGAARRGGDQPGARDGRGGRRAAARPPWRRRCTSSRWRPCRTPRSTPGPAASASASRRDGGRAAAHRRRRRRRLRCGAGRAGPDRRGPVQHA